MDYKLTVICPGIRTKNWLRLYESVASAFSGSWELIFVGPYPLPAELEGKENIQYIQDWGSPIRCQQIGLMKARGEYINWAADDGIFLPESLDVGFNKLEGQPYDTVIMGKYYEGNNDGDMPMQENAYYILSNHDASKSPYIPIGFFMLNVGLVSTKLLCEVGGWDAEIFEVCPMAYNDLAIRLQRRGSLFIVQSEMMFRCSHLPGHAGDHGPIHDAQVFFDQPRFSDIYFQPECQNRIEIDLDNWQKAPSHWERRFGKK